MTSYTPQSDIVSNLSVPSPSQAINRRMIYGFGGAVVVIILSLSIALGVVANKSNDDKPTYNYPPYVQSSNTQQNQQQPPATCPQQTAPCQPQVIMCPDPSPRPAPDPTQTEMPTTATCLKQYGANPTHLQVANCVLESFPLIDG